MSDEIDGIIVIVPEPPRRPPIHVDHWCEHAGCQQWGGFGYTTRYGQLWLCGGRDEGEAVVKR